VVLVTGIGLSSALGDRAKTWQRLLGGESGITVCDPFKGVGFNRGQGLRQFPLAMLGDRPAELEPLLAQTVAQALDDAELSPPLGDCGVVVGSSRSFQAVWERYAAHRHLTQQFEPFPGLEWLNTLPHMPAIATARQIQSQGPVMAPMAACATGLWAIAQGFLLIQSGQCDRVLVGAVETPITPLTLAGFSQMGALAKTGAYPFDCDREGLVLGEAAAVLMLESEASVQARSAQAYGRILGTGLTADGYHVSAPDPSRSAAMQAVEHCLNRSGLQPAQIGYIHAHGTATRLNDRNEAALIQKIFPHGVPVSSTKGATGHTLGASGALGAAFCLMALKTQQLPPCVGLRNSEFLDLNLVTHAERTSVQTGLCFSFGFGGQNAVVAIGQP